MEFRWRGNIIYGRYVMEEHDRTIGTNLKTRRDTWRLEAKYCTIIIYKREDTESVGNYRGISLLCTVYKWYVEILRIKLEEKE